MTATTPPQNEPSAPPIQDVPGVSTSAEETESREPALKSIVERFGDVEVVLSCILGKTTMPLRELLALKSENIVTVDRFAEDDLELIINGVSLGLADVNVIGNQVLLLVTERNNVP